MKTQMISKKEKSSTNKNKIKIKMRPKKIMRKKVLPNAICKDLVQKNINQQLRWRKFDESNNVPDAIASKAAVLNKGEVYSNMDCTHSSNFDSNRNLFLCNSRKNVSEPKNVQKKKKRKMSKSVSKRSHQRNESQKMELIAINTMKMKSIRKKPFYA